MTWDISFGISPHLPLTGLRGNHAHSHCSSNQVCKRMFEALKTKKEIWNWVYIYTFFAILLRAPRSGHLKLAILQMATKYQ